MKKNEKGITLTALVVYVTVMSIAIAAIATITTYTYKNMNTLEEDSRYAVELNKFDMYFLKDVKKAEKIIIQEDQENEEDNYHKITMKYKDEDNRVCFATYEWDTYGLNIIRGCIIDDINTNIKLCSKVTNCKFSKSNRKIRVQFTINNKEQKDMEYIAENLQTGN